MRWGFAAAAPVTIFLAGLYPVLIFVASRWLEPDFFSVQRAHFFRPIYLVALGYLIAYLGEHERRSKQKLERHARPHDGDPRPDARRAGRSPT